MNNLFFKRKPLAEEKFLEQPAAEPSDQPGLSFATDDEYLLRKAIEASPEKGFELLFRRYYLNLCNHAVRFVYSPEIAEDIVSELFTVLWQSKGYERIHISYRTYLYKAVRHRSYNYLKWQFDKTTSIDAVDLNEFIEPTNPDEALQYTDLYQKIEDIVQSMPQQCRRAYILKRMEGKKYTEIAAEMEISPRSVESLVSRALSMLRGALKDSWFHGLFWFGLFRIMNDY